MDITEDDSSSKQKEKGKEIEGLQQKQVKLSASPVGKVAAPAVSSFGASPAPTPGIH